MRVVLVCVHYPPLRSSCAVQMRDLAQEFLSQGHEPIVLVPDENVSSSCVIEILNGVTVCRLNALNTAGVGYFRRALAEAFMPFTMWYGIKKSRLDFSGVDAVIWYSPTIFFGLLVCALKYTTKCKTYLILRDIFPEWMLDLGLMRKGAAYYAFKLFAGLQYFVADVIGVQSPSNLNYLARWKRPRRRLEVLQNWLADAPNIGTSIDISRSALAGRKLFVYIGNMGVAQGMDILLDLAESLQSRVDIGFLFVGRGTELARLKEKARLLGLNNVLFFDEVDSTEMPGLLAQCSVGLVALDPRHNSHNIPGKFLTYLQAGLPVLARINSGTDLVGVIEKEQVGKVYVGGDCHELGEIALALLENESEIVAISERCKKLSHRLFSSSSAVQQIVTALE